MAVLQTSFTIFSGLSSMLIRRAKYFVPVSSLKLDYCQWCFLPYSFKYPTMSVQVRQKHKKIHCPEAQSTEDLLSYGDHLLNKLKCSKINEKDLNIIRHNFTRIMYELYKRKNSNLIPYFEKIKNYNTLTEAGYLILMRYYADEADFKNINGILNILKENKDIQIHLKSYIPGIVVSLKLGKFEESSKLLREMTSIMKPPYNSSGFEIIVNTCVELRTSDNNNLLSQFMEELFKVLQEFGPNELNKTLVDAVLSWFRRDPENLWDIQTTYVEKHGVCNYCMKQLKSANILPHRLSKLKENLLNIIEIGIKEKNARFFHKDRHTVEGLKKEILSLKFENNKISTVNENGSHLLGHLNKHLDKHGPFDIVIDAMNLGYCHKYGFNTKRLMNVVDAFIQQKLRILIICAGSLVNPKKTHLQEVSTYLHLHCSLYFVKSQVKSQCVDDYYILYTLLHQNLDIKLVTNDMLGDHLHLFDIEAAADFKCWQKTNQCMVKTWTRNEFPIFHVCNNFRIAMQKHENGWHIPITDEIWYCISNIS